ncbi:TIGR01777 family oxidoreductase [Sanguibacter antarcticus]|uniref:TIGR01777 family protein n=1 Tax=Sanguibacter antarcticus TaxID=372484 RepID=A0A2A9E3W8_9MICO|nr:TIGR01777 family oxidoreductase [Sanguibacter antarcticus]PFG32889.1 hypothetical protein ATL42_0741 [Sanguibacter antarcticus]
MPELVDSRQTIVVAGSSGLIGTALVRALRADGHTVRTLVRGPATTASQTSWDPAGGHLPSDALDGADAVVNLAGAGVADHRWTESYRTTILDSRVSTTSLLAQALSVIEHPAPVLVQASAIGIYGERGDEVLTETSARGDGFLADVVEQWEAATTVASEAGVRVALARSGIVMSPTGGALAKQLPLVRLGLGGRLGSGKQFWSWITLEDEVRALRHLIAAPVSGPVNLTAPEPARNAAIMAALGAAFHRPTILPVPAFALKIALGDFSSEILGSQRVVPAALMQSGFRFSHPTFDAAASWLRPRS